MHLWYKNAIIYELDVETFSDSNGDGIGDFRGLTNRLDYLAGLGITSLWLTPFYPSPNRDNGYDITDYYGVDPRLGTLGDFVEFAYQANNYGIRIIVDLVINHTSNEHPWFRIAREDPDSQYHDFYIWSDTKPEDPVGVVFPGVQESTWTYDEKADQYYFHRFYKHQPDLNVANEAVQEEIRRIMGFWLELGVAGFRMDAAPFVIELKQIDHGIDVKDKHAYIRSYRDFLSWRRGDAILLAEANVSTDVMQEYFGTGDKMHMLFNFIANQHLFASLATHEATPLIESYRKLPAIPDMGQWGNFLRNHDELALGRLASDIKKQVFDEFAPQENMRIYDRGIRRRLAPILNNDRAQIELAHSLMFTLPGTPILRYGQEIGMGENLSLPERNSVRTPMQWTPEKNAGFSKAPTDELIRPVISEGEYHYEKVNVEKQQRDKNSLLAWMQRAINLRRQCPEFGYGTFEILEVDNPSLLVHQCKWNGGHVVAVHNFADSKAQFPVEKISNKQAIILLDLFGDHEYTPAQDSNEHIELEGFGYRWFRIERPS
jgi:maltose alpha-D-glucosyltransferase/alpha-amylase